MEWEGFDIDVRCVGAAILWSKRDAAEKIGKISTVEVLGTEAQHPAHNEKWQGCQRESKSYGKSM